MCSELTCPQGQEQITDASTTEQGETPEATCCEAPSSGPAGPPPPSDTTVCTPPGDTTGYTVTETQLNAIGFNVSVECADGFEGNPTATACNESGPYGLSGCTATTR